MNVKDVLTQTVNYFKKHQVPQPRLDAEVLLAHLLGMEERIQLYVNYDLPLKDEEIQRFRDMVVSRVKGVPVAYITGEKEFMSLKFIVDNRVLIPRPETEHLVEAVIEFCQQNKLQTPHIVDVGTGSGAIAVSLAYYLREALILGIDISSAALKVAKENIIRYEMEDRVKVAKGDLLKPLISRDKQNVDIVVSNPPYISADEMKGLSSEVKKEPEIALAGGQDGLELYRRLIPQAEKVLKPGGLLALEIGAKQGKGLTEILKNDWENVRVIKDFAGKDRVVLASCCKEV